MEPQLYRGKDQQNTCSRSGGNKCSEENISREERGWHALRVREATVVKSCQGKSHGKGDI